MNCLPFEFRCQVLDLAVGYDPLSDPTLVKPTTYWQRSKDGDGNLMFSEPTRTELSMRAAHLRCNKTRKAIVLTCRDWADIMREHMFRVILVRDSTRLASIHAVLENQPAHAELVEAVYIGKNRHRLQFSITFDSIDTYLVPLIRRCGNLKILAIDDSTADPLALRELLVELRTPSLQSLRMRVLSEVGTKVLVHHPCLQSLEVFGDDLNTPSILPSLRELYIRGSGPRFQISNLSSWQVTSLTTLIIDCNQAFIGEAQLEEALTPIASQLLYFSISAGILDIGIRWITSRCANLETLCVSYSQLSRHDQMQHAEDNMIHNKLETLGLFMAFDLHEETRNFMMLNKENFPKLSRIKLLLYRNRAKHLITVTPQHVAEWHEHCNRIGVRLEDHAGKEIRVESRWDV